MDKKSLLERPTDPCVFVIFGALGDLTKRKLIPALYNLACEHLLPENFAIVGVARNKISTEAFRRAMHDAIHEFSTEKEIHNPTWESLQKKITYVEGEFHDPSTYSQLAEKLLHCNSEYNTSCNYLYYLATPPNLFGEIPCQLEKVNLTSEQQNGKGWRRIVIEKPFGHDLESSKTLNASILNIFNEHQVYRIDHYLGKETVQNLLVFRFANGMLEPVWNRRYIDHVQITVAESIGVEGRGRYYEKAGLLRDVIQNHMFQLLTLVAMEPPVSFEAEAVRNEKVKVLNAVRPFKPEEVLTQTVRGQYGEGILGEKQLTGYRSEAGVSQTSNTETYAALKIYVDNWRWAGVPFYLRSGKRLPKRVTEIVIQFNEVPLMLFQNTSVGNLRSNRLIIHIQPREGISLQFEAKIPGPRVQTKTVSMDFNYEDFFGTTLATGYETLLYDVMKGDETLFHRSDIVEASWKIATPILDVWNTLPARNFPNYDACTSWGPAEADEMLSKDGRSWRQV